MGMIEKLTAKIMQMLEKIQEIGQEQDSGPDKVLSKLLPCLRKMKKTVKFWIKYLVVGGKNDHKIKQKLTSNST